MKRRKTIYLDNAATTFPKPAEVMRRVEVCLKELGGNPGRGSHGMALAAAEEVYRCRREAAELFGTSHPERGIFTMNATQALNIAIKGLVRPGDHVLCSDMEHNAVWRPLCRLAEAGVIEFDVFDTLPDAPMRTEDRILSSITARLTPKTSLIVCAHASNICSATLPLEAIGRLCRRRGIRLIVDASQSAGAYPIDMERMGIDALCMPGHKGLYGPQGCGLLLLGEGITPATLMEGGNGVDSLRCGMGESLPERYEPGTLPTPALSGLHAGMAFVRQTGIEAIRAHETALCEQAKAGLMSIPGVTVYAPQHRGGILLFSVNGHASEDVGTYLDSQGICVRPGFHCTALGHRTLGTPSGGAVRASFGYFNTERDVEALVRAMRGMAK